MLYLIKKYYIIIFVLFVSLYKFTVIYVAPYYNAKFTNYHYRYPKFNEKFIVGTETEPINDTIPEFVINILKLAFYDRELIIDNNQSPNFIVRFENFKGYKQKDKYNAPYITISSERWTIKRHKYRKNGPPLAEIVSTTPTNPRQLYFPFMAWSKIVPERIYTNNKHRKFLAYVSSNCVSKRERLFALIKKLNPDAEALGLCSNPNKTRFPGGYGNLDKIYAQYDFGFAMENAQVPGYITEKIALVFRGGAIPIYWGDSNTVNKYFNPKAFINVDQFKNFQEAAEYIVTLSPQQIEAIKAEPIFINNQRSEIFDITNNPKHPLLQDAAVFIRNEYFKILSNQKSS